MNRYRIVFTICTLLAGAVWAVAQEPAPAPLPRPRPLHDMDELRAQVKVLRSEIDADAIRDSVREQLEGLRAQLTDVEAVKAQARELARAGVAGAVSGVLANVVGRLEIAP